MIVTAHPSFLAHNRDPNICPFGEDILCWDYDLAEAGHQYAQADGGGTYILHIYMRSPNEKQKNKGS